MTSFVAVLSYSKLRTLCICLHVQDSSCRLLLILGLGVPTSCTSDMGLGASSYLSIRKQAIVENTSKEIISYSINKQDKYTRKEGYLPMEST